MIVWLITIIPAAIALLLAVFLALEVAGAFLPAKKRAAGKGEPGSVAVIIPAHNEAASIGATLSSVMAQARDVDRVIVIADNCTDETATIAADSGAECWARHDQDRRGKGYALQFALDRLKEAPPETVIFVDADCIVEEGALLKLARLSESESRPVQALYLMTAPEGASPRLRIAEFAWLFLNQVRMRGLDRLFGVSRITGAGMALPWRLAESLNIGSGEIVEDLALTLDLTERRAAPILLLDALVTSNFPDTEEAIAKQRARWEHGSQRLAAKRALPCLVKGAATGNFRLCAIAADLMIPPIMNFVGGIVIVTAVCTLAFLFGARAPLVLSVMALLIVSASIGAAWLKFGMTALPLSSLRGLVPFLAGKRAIYGAEGRESAKGWTPTRGGDTDGRGER